MSIETPWQVRWVRFFWTREAIRKGASGRVDAQYAKEAVRRWREDGQVPVVGISRDFAFRSMDQGLRAPP